MARMRVHELAKELNVNSKELIERILKLGIPVKNHMSTLDQEAAERIRENFNEIRKEQIEEKRIGRRVIRRRRKPIAVEPEQAPAPELEAEAERAPSADAVAAEAASEEVGAAEQVSPEAVSAEPQPVTEAVTPAAEEPEQESAEAAAAPAEEQAEAGPAMEQPVEPPDETSAVSAVEPETAPVSAPAPEAPGEDTARRPEMEERVAEVEPATREEEPMTTQEAAAEKPEAAPEMGAETETEEDKAKPKKGKRRRRKKGRKDEPARIIKLPEPVPDEVESPVAQPTVSRARPEPTPAREPARKKKLRGEVVRESRPHRPRKEVVEGDRLYTRKERVAQARHGKGKGKKAARRVSGEKTLQTVPKALKRRIKVDEAITVANLAKQMGVKAGEVIKKLLLLGLPANINQAINFDAASLIASEFGFEVEKAGFEEEEILQIQEDRPEDLLPRPPVVTVMGHVDHGKTSLLDAIRHTNVISGEAGGITQHIGAYYVKLDGGDIVFLDTPGHEAFTAMRARGAKVTDIVVLVVAADDGVMQQTVEAINHSKAAGVTIMVAINKIDKPEADVERVKRELAEHGLIPEEWGGDITMVEVSAKRKIGIDNLLEMILLQAELLELKANPNKAARGHVIEAKLDKGRGPVATILIQEGTLHSGDVYVCGIHSGRVRNMFNDRGQRIDRAGPSHPVEVLGFSGVPEAGDDFVVLDDEKQAKLVAENRKLKRREKELSRTTKVTLEKLYEQIQEGEIKEVNVVLKCDVQGSLEAITDSLRKLSTHDVKVSLIHSGTGAITESDIMLASASNAIVIGFNVRADAKVNELADQEKVDIRYYDVIYKLIADMKDAMVGLLEPIYEENVLGRAEVRQTFNVPKVGTVAGCYVTDGRVVRNGRVRVLRDQVVIYDGKLASLRRFKDDVKEVKSGFECGMGVENFNDIKVGDVLEIYELVEVQPSLDIDQESNGD